MSADRPQFDILLGGSQELPQDMSIMNFASARAQEILSLTEALRTYCFYCDIASVYVIFKSSSVTEEPRKTGLVFQRLPRHMRRRVMSHNAKRMPRQLREAHIRQMEKSGLPPKSKRPSRKYRRRPSNLLEAYNRRQREYIWLETHIWHAKRFHMTSKWGYKLAHFPNDKSARACYRGAANHCLIQDISYYACIELKGGFELITNGLKMLTRYECGLTFSAKAWQKGDREGSVTMFYHDSKYPHGAIGRVHFLWKPLVNLDDIDKRESSLIKVKCEKADFNMDVATNSERQRTLWIWVHPSYYNEVKEELLKVFKLKLCLPVPEEENISEPPCKKAKSEKLKSTLKSKSKLKQSNLESIIYKVGPSIPYNHIPQYAGNNVQMALLKDTLIRFRLTGPLSQAVLRETLFLAPLNCDKNLEGFPWWAPWEDIFKCQKQIWEDMASITSPAMVSPHMVIGLTILDPRCNIPEKRTKAVDLDCIYNSEIVQGYLPLEASASPIWNPQIRDSVTTSKPTDALVNKKRSENLVPGIVEDSENTESTSKEERNGFFPRVPLLLVQRPGSQDSSRKRLGYCAGWDVIAPAGWGKPLWLALVLRGARAGGLREAEMVENIGFSQMLCRPPLPDTNAGKIEMKQRQMEAKEKYFRLPPNKRPNYAKLGISSPFSCPWDILCHEWSNSALNSRPSDSTIGTFYVLRDLCKLRQISEVLQKIKNEKIVQSIVHLSRTEGSDIPETEGSEAFFSELLNIGADADSYGSDHCLVPIRVTICQKGIITDNAIICLPIQKDFQTHKNEQCKAELKGPEESINPDPYQEERKNLRREHKRNLARLRRERVKERKEADEYTPDGDEPSATAEDEPKSNAIPRRPPMGPAATAEMCEEHKKKMEEMFLPPVFEVRKSCSREVAGYVTRGMFSFSDAKEIGMAYIALPALISLLRTKVWNPKLLVFARNTHCTHYIPATIELITN